jgi:hypothetical protein
MWGPMHQSRANRIENNNQIKGARSSGMERRRRRRQRATYGWRLRAATEEGGGAMEAIPTLPVHERERSNLQSHTYQSATDFSKQDALIVKRIEPQSRSNRTASKAGSTRSGPGRTAPRKAAVPRAEGAAGPTETAGGGGEGMAYRRRRCFSGEFLRRRRRLIKRRSVVWVLVRGCRRRRDTGCRLVIYNVPSARHTPTRQVPPLARPGVGFSGERTVVKRARPD